MSTTALMYIPEKKIGVFNDILKTTGGRYIGSPVYLKHSRQVSVHFSHNDYGRFSEAWQRVNTPIREAVRQPSFAERLKIKVGLKKVPAR